MRSCSPESQYSCRHYLPIIGAHPLFATQHTKPGTACGGRRQKDTLRSKARIANVGNPASSQMPAVPGYSECHRGLIQISPYNAWFTRVQHQADHGPPLRATCHACLARWDPDAHACLTRWEPGTRFVGAELARPDATSQENMQTCTGHSPHPAAPSSGDS